MPFKSKAQQRWMYKNHPDMAERWAAETDFAHLPARKKRKKRGKARKGKRK